MNIFLVSGYAGSGKSHAAELLQTIHPAARKTAFAKKVKDDVAQIYSIPRHLCDTQEGKKTYVMTSQGDCTVRELLIDYSAHAKKLTNNPGIWADFVVEEIQKNPEFRTWILEDWRYKHEYETMVRAFPSARIHRFRIRRPGVTPSADPSEHDLDDEPVDYDVYNTGNTQELQTLLYMYRS